MADFSNIPGTVDHERRIVEAREAEIDRLRAALDSITKLGGNLSDERLLAIGGVNDGRSRANMYVFARQIARIALSVKGG